MSVLEREGRLPVWCLPCSARVQIAIGMFADHQRNGVGLMVANGDAIIETGERGTVFVIINERGHPFRYESMMIQRDGKQIGATFHFCRTEFPVCRPATRISAGTGHRWKEAFQSALPCMRSSTAQNPPPAHALGSDRISMRRWDIFAVLIFTKREGEI